MDPDKDTHQPDDEAPKDAPSVDEQPQQAPADALSLTPDEVKEEEVEQGIEPEDDAPVEVKLSPLKRLFRKVNIYFLAFLLVVIVVGVIAVVNYLNSQKPPATPNIANQTLTQSALAQLANTNASVGNTSQTLTIQGNAVINGQTLTRGDLNVASKLQTGGSITGPSLVVSGTANLGSVQANTLQVASNVAVQGGTTLAGLNVAGASSFGGPMTASQITTSNLTISGNGILQVPNHISFSGGPTPGHSSGGALGNGGSVNINGSDTSGTLNVNTGGNTSAGCFATINFTQSYGTQPRVIVTPVGSAAGQTQWYINRGPSNFSVCTDNAAPANAQFAFDYFVAG